MFSDLPKRLGLVHAWVAGDVMLDEYILGSVSRISPEAPVPVVDVHTRKYVAGGAANVAINLAALGCRSSVTGLAASDEAGRRLRALLNAAGVDTTPLIDSGDRYTICKTRIVAGRQQIVRIDHEQKAPMPPALLAAARTAAEAGMTAASVVVLSDYAKGLLDDDFCAFAIALARQRRIPIIVDPKGEDFRKYRGCTVITPNLNEAARAAGVAIDSETALYTAGERLLRLLPGTHVLITRGGEGMTLFRAGEEPLTVPTVARQVYDVTGAGDTVVAALAASLGAGIALPQAMRLANIAAGIVVDKPGTASASVEEILNHEGSRDLALT